MSADIKQTLISLPLLDEIVSIYAIVDEASAVICQHCTQKREQRLINNIYPIRISLEAQNASLVLLTDIATTLADDDSA
jgi:hypothetical protein